MKSPNSLKSSNLSGFTLIELLVVVTIIVVLSALTVGAMSWVQRKSAIESTRAQMALIENGLELYYNAAGAYPEGKDKTGIIIYKALYGDGVGPDGILGTDDDSGSLDGQPDEGATVYVAELDPIRNTMKMMDPAGPGTRPARVIDAFGTPYTYAGGEAAEYNPDFDLISAGPDQRFGTEDDIKNW